MSADKYPSIFSRQMETIVFITDQIFLNTAFSEKYVTSEQLCRRSNHFHSVLNVEFHVTALGMKTKAGMKINRKILNLGNITWGIFSDIF